MNWADRPYAIGRGIAAIRHNRGLQMQPFLRAVIEHELPNLLVQATGSTFPNVSSSLLARTNWPKFDEGLQVNASRYFALLDDKIDLLREMNRTLEEMARAVFRAWFVDFLPVRAKADGATSFRGMPQALFDQLPTTFTDSDIGEIPDGWGVGRVDDLLDHPRRAANPNEIESTTPYIGLEHMPRRSITLGEWETAEKVTSNKHRFERQEILFGKLRPNFHKVGVTFVEGVCSTDIVVLRPVKPEFFGLGLACVSSDEFVAHNVVASSGTKMPRTNWEIIARYELAVPPETSGIISGFDTIIRSLVYKLEANTLEIATLSGLRDTLLPKLISGELEAPDLDTLGLTPIEAAEASDGG